MLENKGLVGPADGAKPREVYENPTVQNRVDLIPGAGEMNQKKLQRKITVTGKRFNISL